MAALRTGFFLNFSFKISIFDFGFGPPTGPFCFDPGLGLPIPFCGFCGLPIGPGLFFTLPPGLKAILLTFPFRGATVDVAVSQSGSPAWE